MTTNLSSHSSNIPNSERNIITLGAHSAKIIFGIVLATNVWFLVDGGAGNGDKHVNEAKTLDSLDVFRPASRK
jgi:hypothetical protein